MAVSRDLVLSFNDYSTPEGIAARGSFLEGMTFQEVLDLDISPEGVSRDYGNKRYKGGMGTLVEERFFGYKANSDHDADFPEAGVELKATCFDRKKNGDISAGERLSLTMIPHDSPLEDDFDDAIVARKSKKIMLVYYERDKSLEPYEQRIRYSKLFVIPESDLQIIRDDYHKIVSYIKAGRAAELSEGLTMYLGASTKGPSAKKSMVHWIYSPEGSEARTRGFCLKRQYMDYVLHHYLMGESETADCIVKGPKPPEETFEDYVLSLIERHVGKTDRELCEEFGLPYKGNKAQWSALSYAMLGVRGEKASEFEKANISVRAVRVEPKGGIRENLSLNTFEFVDLLEEEDWEHAALHDYLEETRFFFVVFQKEEGCSRLVGARFWSMPLIDLDGPVQECWSKTRHVIEEGVELTRKQLSNGKERVENNLPSQKNNPIAHVRPHASRSAYRFEDGTEIGDVEKDAYPLPDGRMMTKQSFWMNSDYIYRVIDFPSLGEM